MNMGSNYVIVGSTASAIRKPNDLDVMYYGDRPNLTSDRRIEYHEEEPLLIEALLNGSSNNIANRDTIYTLKLSHVFWPINHDKTIADIIKLSREDCQIDHTLFYFLKSYWTAKHGNKDFLSLKRSANDFFNDYVTKVVDHDLLHEWVAKDTPLYKRCLKDGEEVLIDQKKFSDLTFEDQLHMIREEIMVIALERFAIPKKFDIPSGLCYYRSAKLTITNLLKNRFADFMAFNLDKIICYDMRKEFNVVKEKMKGIDYVS